LAAVTVLLAAPQALAQDRGAVLTVGAGGMYRPDAVDASWTGVAMVELSVPLRVIPVGLWMGTAVGYQRSNGGSYEGSLNVPRVKETGLHGLGGFYLGLHARTPRTVYFHGGAALLVAGVWSRLDQTITDATNGITDKRTVSSGAGIGGIAAAGLGLDLRVLTLQLDAFFLGAAAGDLNSFVGYGGRLMVGATIF
jgi:hypothetical protein